VKYQVGSQRFETAAAAFRFAQKEADRFGQPVDIHQGTTSWFGTAKPTPVKQPPTGFLALPKEASA